MTQTYVATMPELKEKAEHGKYYIPQKNWKGRYTHSVVQKPDTKWGEDDEMAAELWTVSEEALRKSEAATA